MLFNCLFQLWLQILLYGLSARLKEFDQHCELWEKEKNIKTSLIGFAPPPPQLNIFDGI
jgi:hypothetical protein